MTLKAALDNAETAIILVEKSDASPADKLNALRPLLYQLRADLIEVSEHSYQNYIEAEDAPQTDMQALDFDDADVQEKFYDNLSVQEINNLRNYYDLEAFQEIDNARIRVCLSRALCQIASEKGVTPNKSWLAVISAEGNI